MEIASAYKNQFRNYIYIFGLRQWVFAKPCLLKPFECKKKKKKYYLDVSYYQSIRKTHSDSDARAKMNFRLKWMWDRLRCLICLGYFIINLFASIYFNDHSQESLVYEDHIFFLKHSFMLSWNLPCALFFTAAKSRAAFLPAASAVHKTHIGALTCGERGPWPPNICIREPSWVPHPSLGGFCVLHVLADSEKTRWWIRKRSKPRVYWNRC